MKTITTEGKIKPFGGGELKNWQAEVGGLIEVIRLQNRDGQIMVVNEEGLLRHLDYNPIASYYAGQHIFGDAIVCKDNELE